MMKKGLSIKEKKKVDVEKFGAFCGNPIVLIKKFFPFVKIPIPTHYFNTFYD